MTLDTQAREVAEVVRRELAARGRTFDGLTHNEQLRVADAVSLPVTALTSALAQLAEAEKGGKAAMIFDTRTGHVTGGGTLRLDQVGDSWVGDGPEHVREMLADSRSAVWPTVVVIEQRLGLRPRGSRCERYERVSARLEKLRQRSVKGKLSDEEDRAVDRYRRRLKAAEDAYWRRADEEAEALSSLERQRQAARRAAAMAGGA